jgi:hypothetical protein
MNKKVKVGIVALVLVALLAVIGVGVALAQEEEPPTPLEAAAEVLGLTEDELSLQLWGGKSLAELADQAGVDLQTVQDAVQDARMQNRQARLDQAVEEGKITQEQADWLLEGLENGFVGGGPGGMMGRRGGRFGGRGGGRGGGRFGGAQGGGGCFNW